LIETPKAAKRLNIEASLLLEWFIMKTAYRFVVFGIFIAIIAVVFVSINPKPLANKNNNTQTSNTANQNLSNSSATDNSNDLTIKSAGTLSLPLANAKERITKKPFGIQVSPKNSPVSPERFTGYHTGTDFETTPEEQNIDVPVMAICSGPLLESRSASGYGGVAVQSCRIDNQDVTVVYGHLKLVSVSTVVGRQMSAGQKFAVLGKGYTSETNGERKHLHLGIHKGTAINILGYVSSPAGLESWLDPAKYL
jgi:hypothetical protein